MMGIGLFLLAPLAALILSQAPDPVPPPMPAVTKTMSVPWRICSSASFDSEAARAPTSGLPPAPRPLVARWHEPLLSPKPEER